MLEICPDAELLCNWQIFMDSTFTVALVTTNSMKYLYHKDFHAYGTLLATRHYISFVILPFTMRFHHTVKKATYKHYNNVLVKILHTSYNKYTRKVN